MQNINIKYKYKHNIYIYIYIYIYKDSDLLNISFVFPEKGFQSKGQFL